MLENTWPFAIAGVAALVALKCFWSRGASSLLLFPAAFTVAYFLLEACIAPLATIALGFETTDPTVLRVGSADPSEYPMATLALSLHYAFILIGLGLGWKLAGGTTPLAKHAENYNLRHPLLDEKLWRGSFCAFLVGLSAQLLVMSLLLQSGSLSSLAAERAFFSNEEVVFTSSFNYLSFFIPFMEIGIWGMLIFGVHRRRPFPWQLAAPLVVALNVVYGGRTKTVLSILMLIFIYQLVTRRLKVQQIVVASIAIVLSLVVISFARFGAEELWSGLQRTIQPLFYARRLEQSAFMLRSFPDVYDFFQGRTLLPGLAFSIPGLKLPGTNLYNYLMGDIIGSFFYERGFGGGNYAAAAEHYANFRWPGIVAIALAYGTFFGAVFGWCNRHRQTSHVLLLFAAFVPWFINGLDTRAVAMWAGCFPRALAPVGFVLACSFPASSHTKRLVFSLLIFFILFGVSRYITFFKPLMICSIAITYFIIALMLRAASRVALPYERKQIEPA